MTSFHRLSASAETVRIGEVDRTDSPVLTIDSGDIVDIETWTAWGNQVTPQLDIARAEELIAAGGSRGPHDVTGPIAVRNAHPGDVLRVDILDIRLRPHGYNINLPGAVGLGLLADEMPAGAVRHYAIPEGGSDGVIELAEGFVVQVNPFLGYMGVAPRDAGPHSSIPPGPHGGNIDVPDLTAGSTLYLPVWADGALFTAGDAHAAQGYGEIDLTCIEASAEHAILRLTVLRGDSPIAGPRAETRREYITLGFAETLLDACRAATRDMIQEITRRFPQVDSAQAYAMCAIAMDLKVSQVVNMPMYGCQASLRKSYLRAGTPWFTEEAGWRAI